MRPLHSVQRMQSDVSVQILLSHHTHTHHWHAIFQKGIFFTEKNSEIALDLQRRCDLFHLMQNEFPLNDQTFILHDNRMFFFYSLFVLLWLRHFSLTVPLSVSLKHPSLRIIVFQHGGWWIITYLQSANPQKSPCVYEAFWHRSDHLCSVLNEAKWLNYSI